MRFFSLIGISFLFMLPSAYAEFPQMKINFVDTSEAPHIRIWASVARERFRPPGESDVLSLTVLKKPATGRNQELFSFKEGEPEAPKGTDASEAEALLEKFSPELNLAGEGEAGQAIVVLVPGHQEPEYRDGTLGERSQASVGLFFKKLGQNNLMNVIWYNDFIYSYVRSAERDGGLTKLDGELEACRKWERESLKWWGLSDAEKAEQIPDVGDGYHRGEAHCGLTDNYGDFPKYISKMAYDGFWPQLFGLQQRLCVSPQHEMRQTGFQGGDRGFDDKPEKRLNAFETGLQMLAKLPDPKMPKIMIISSDGRDGYIDATSDCRTKHQMECEDDNTVSALRGLARREAKARCVAERLKGDLAIEQGSFIDKLPAWVGLAKAANIRIYSVIHPNAAPHMRDRLEVLAWRTGGTARYAEDADDLADLHEQLIAELNNQLVVSFYDEDVAPNEAVSYALRASGYIGARGSQATASSEPYEAFSPLKIELPLLTEIQIMGEEKLGVIGFWAALLVLALLILLLFLFILVKLFGFLFGGSGKPAKGGKDKAETKAQAKAKKKAIKKALKAKKAKEKLLAKEKKG